MKSALVFLSFRCFGIYCLLHAFISMAEGTKEFRPQSTQNGGIMVSPNVDASRPFALFNGNADYRMNVHICNAGETIQMGFGDIRVLNGTTPYLNTTVRLVDPNGNVVVAPTPIIPTQTLGYIASYNQAVSGPISTRNPTGYTPISHTTTIPGDYYIEFNQNTPIINLFDVTVLGTDSQIKKGRLWSKAWLINTGAGPNPFFGSLFVYTDDLITTKINFNGIQPFEFIISSNSSGTSNTGNLVNDRRSVYGNSTFPQYKIFLNEPDSACFPTGFIGSIVGNPSITGCPGKYCINVEVTAPGIMQFAIDANGITGIQQGTSDRMIQANVITGKNCIPWDGKDGLGNSIDTNIVNISMGISYINGLTHLPMYDVENHTNGYIVSYVRPKVNQGNIPLQWDDSRLTKIANTTLDGVTNFLGCSTNGCHKWQNRGQNNGGNCATQLCPETVNTWWYVKESQAKVTSNISFKDIDANRNKPGKGPNNDTLVCASVPSLPINGIVLGDTGVVWSIKKGSGTFLNTANKSTQYVFGASDLISDHVTFVITSKGDACPAVTDSMRVFIDPIKTIDIPSINPVCSKSPIAQDLAASTNHVNKILWSGGDGSMTPNRNTRNVKYTPTNQEYLSGTVTLYAQSNDALVACPNVRDSVILHLAIPPQVTAPKDTQICAKESLPFLILKSKYEQADTVIWSINGDPANLAFQNSDSARLILQNNQNVSITLTASKAGCPNASDISVISYAQSPILQATATPTCESNRQLSLKGQFQQSLATDVFAWDRMHHTGVFAKDSNTLENTYLPSAQDIDSGYVTLALRHIVVAKCAAKDTLLKIKLPIPPNADAGKDTSTCTGNSLLHQIKKVNGLNYEWRMASGANAPIISTSDTVRVLLDHDRILYLTVIDPTYGCTDTDSVMFMVFTPPSIVLPPDFCLKGPVDLKATLQQIPSLGTYSWTHDSKVLDNTNPSININDAGTYVYSYRHFNCISADTVKVLPSPKAQISGFVGCIQSTGELIADSLPRATYTWDNTPATNNRRYTVVATQGTKLIPLKITDSLGCTFDTLGMVRGTPKPDFRLLAQNICDGNIGHVYLVMDDTTLAQDPSFGYSWHFNQNPLQTKEYKEALFQQSGIFEASLQIGTCMSSQTTGVKVFPNPAIIIEPKHKYCFEETEGIWLLPQNDDSSYIWQSGDRIISRERNLLVHPSSDTRYHLTVTNTYGCKDSTPVEVRVTCPPRLFVPNVITPQSKDINAFLNIFGAFFKDFELTIFNRWGEIIYHTTDPNAPWDGTYKGEDMPIGVYPWIASYNAEYDDFRGVQKYVQKGDVTIVR